MTRFISALREAKKADGEQETKIMVKNQGWLLTVIVA
jgi:hypothetical protein